MQLGFQIQVGSIICPPPKFRLPKAHPAHPLSASLRMYFAVSNKTTLGYLETKKTTGLVEDYTTQFSHVYVMLMFSYVK